MNREQAEQLLAKLIFDELHTETRDELLAYLDNDPLLREQLGDMRLTVNLIREGATAESPTLDETRRQKLLELEAHTPEPPAAQPSGVIYTIRAISAVAAVLLFGLGITILLPSLGGRDEPEIALHKPEADFEGTEVADAPVPTGPPDDRWGDDAGLLYGLESSKDPVDTHDRRLPQQSAETIRDGLAKGQEKTDADGDGHATVTLDYRYAGVSGETFNKKIDSDDSSIDLRLAEQADDFAAWDRGSTERYDHRSYAIADEQPADGRDPHRSRSSGRTSQLDALSEQGVVAGYAGADASGQEVAPHDQNTSTRNFVSQDNAVSLQSGTEITTEYWSGGIIDDGVSQEHAEQWSDGSDAYSDHDGHAGNGVALGRDAVDYDTYDSKNTTNWAMTVPQRGQLAEETDSVASNTIVSTEPVTVAATEGEPIVLGKPVTRFEAVNESNQAGASFGNGDVVTTNGRFFGEKSAQAQPQGGESAMALGIEEQSLISEGQVVIVGGSMVVDGEQQTDQLTVLRSDAPALRESISGDPSDGTATVTVNGSGQVVEGAGGTSLAVVTRPESKMAVTSDNFAYHEEADDVEARLAKEREVELERVRRIETQFDSRASKDTNSSSETQTKELAEAEDPVQQVASVLQPETSALPTASQFAEYPVNPWVMSDKDNLSTFALDTDAASYRLCARYLRSGYLPPRGAVRMEEFVNAFDYNYTKSSQKTFTVHVEAAPSPFAQAGENTVLVKVGVQGRIIGREGRKPAHLVFVVDASGSMEQPDRLPLAQNALNGLVDNLTPDDRVSLVTYGDKSEVQLEAEAASNNTHIVNRINRIQTTGSTNLTDGLETGYQLAARNYTPDRINRVIMVSDGMANVGQIDANEVVDRVADYRRQGITFTAVGVGAGGFNDELLETLARNGDGNYLFFDSEKEARRQFVDNMDANLQTIAKDAKIQVEFNTTRVRRYRLIGYENRDIADKDFRNDAVDAGEVGSGQAATALYELELYPSDRPAGDPPAIGTVYVRYRNADNDKVEEIAHTIANDAVRETTIAERPRFYLAAAVARFAELLRESPHARDGNFDDVSRVVDQVHAELPLDDRIAELRDLVRQANNLDRAP